MNPDPLCKPSETTMSTTEILVVEDSPSMRQMVAMTLKSAGYAVQMATDGLAALALLDGRRVDLIVSDVNMPRLDGIGLLQVLRENPIYAAYGSVPVIMLTTQPAARIPRMPSEGGPRGWLTKPFRPAQLLEAVSRLVAP